MIRYLTHGSLKISYKFYYNLNRKAKSFFYNSSSTFKTNNMAITVNGQPSKGSLHSQDTFKLANSQVQNVVFESLFYQDNWAPHPFFDVI